MVKKQSKYQLALDYIYSFVDYSLTRQLRYSPEKFNLDRMYKLMELMGSPQEKYPVIHVAGTKGKGSTSAMIASILKEAGYRVGLYTSPHLSDYCERIQTNGKLISHTQLAHQIEEIKPFLAQVEGITTFEITTAIGFKYFLEQKVDIAVIEVGLGGRLDATNIVDPIVSIITSLSFDHMNILGNTIAEIAQEKAGIIKPSRPVILAPQVYPDASKVVEDVAKKAGAPLTIVGREFKYSLTMHSLDGQVFLVEKSFNENKPGQIPSAGEHSYFLPLLGFHQVENATTALAVIQLLRTMNFSINEQNIESGLKNVTWLCRFEIIQKNPLIIVDSAHNPDSATKLRRTIEDYLHGIPVLLIFGASEDKDIKGMLDQLIPIASQVIMTKSIHPRAAEPGLLVELAKKYRIKTSETNSIEDAIKLGRKEAPSNTAIVITGSIFVAAAARDVIINTKTG
jgi:dihydrofolate synthase/folylpolyglutamate synthase